MLVEKPYPLRALCLGRNSYKQMYLFGIAIIDMYTEKWKEYLKGGFRACFQIEKGFVRGQYGQFLSFQFR